MTGPRRRPRQDSPMGERDPTIEPTALEELARLRAARSAPSGSPAQARAGRAAAGGSRGPGGQSSRPTGAWLSRGGPHRERLRRTGAGIRSALSPGRRSAGWLRRRRRRRPDPLPHPRPFSDRRVARGGHDSRGRGVRFRRAAGAGGAAPRMHLVCGCGADRDWPLRVLPWSRRSVPLVHPLPRRVVGRIGGHDNCGLQAPASRSLSSGLAARRASLCHGPRLLVHGRNRPPAVDGGVLGPHQSPLRAGPERDLVASVPHHSRAVPRRARSAGAKYRGIGSTLT